jgi:hypothetical protein
MITSRWASAVLAIAVLVVTAGASAQDVGAPAPSGRSSTRLAVQGRLDLLNILGSEGGIDAGFIDVPLSLLPIITGGFRFDRLFVGAGFGFYGYSASDCDDSSCDSGEDFSGFGWSFAPMLSYDILSEREAAGYILGSVNLLSINSSSSERIEDGMETSNRDADFGWGLNLGLGVRGHVSEGVSIGTEWGWGFVSITPGNADEDSAFVHAIFGAIVFEASVGI